MGGWNEIRVPVGDYLGRDGKIAPIAFTLAYNQSFGPNEDVPGGYIFFDTVKLRESVKVVDENYKNIRYKRNNPFKRRENLQRRARFVQRYF